MKTEEEKDLERRGPRDTKGWIEERKKTLRRKS